MKNPSILNRILAVLGTVLVLLPVLAPFVFGFFSLAGDRQFRFDYLMPAELFLVVLVGAVLILVCAMRVKEDRAWIGWVLGAAVLMLVASQAIAVVTGLADGSTQAASWRLWLVMGGIILYDLLVVGLGVLGIRMMRRVFRAAA